MRAYTGVACGLERGFQFRWFVLTESDEAIRAGKNFWKEFNKFRTWLKYRTGVFEYIIIQHEQGRPSDVSGHPRHNWHILSYGSDKLPIDEIERYWQAHFSSKVTGMARVNNIKKAIRYLAGYLSQEDKFVKCRMSHGWVWPGWISFTKDYKKLRGEYMLREDIAWLATLDKDQRARQLGWAVTDGI